MRADRLAKAFERFLLDHDEAAFLVAIQQYGGHSPASDLDFPIVHRIRDVILCGDAFRILRVYDPDDRMARLYVDRTQTPSDEPGVPYELNGQALHRWVVEESDEPTDGETDWGKYLDENPCH